MPLDPLAKRLLTMMAAAVPQGRSRPSVEARRQSLANLRQRDLPRPSQKQRFADILLDQLDLVAHGSLRHAEFLAGAGEAAKPGGRLEDAKRIQRELFRHFHG